MKNRRIYFGYVVLLMICFMVGCRGKQEEGDKSTIPTVTDVPDKEVEISTQLSEEEATTIVVDTIDKGYYVNYISELEIDGQAYYEFTVLSGEEVIGPSIVVHKYAGGMHVVQVDGSLGDISEHPLLSISRLEDENSINKEEAFELLSRLPKDVLGLHEELEDYTVLYDDITTMIYGEECYGMSVHHEHDEELILEGKYYVSTDGSSIYQFDEIEDVFKELNP